MRAWGMAAFLLVALLSVGAAASPALAAPAPSPPALASTAPILQQTSSGMWRTTVLVTGITGECPAGARNRDDYLLETTSPDHAVHPVSASPATPSRRARGGRTGPKGEHAVPSNPAKKVSAAPTVSCGVILAFARPSAVPATATLVIDGSSSVTLTVSRYLTLGDYLGPPAIWGGGMAVALLILTACFVRVYDRAGQSLRFWRLRGNRAGFWTQRISASGAWTLNDSWATNIVTTAGVLGTVLGVALSPAGTPFHGLGLDRFSILAALAAGIIAAAPLLFAVLYGIWSSLSPGMTDNASVTGSAQTHITVPSGGKVVVPWGASVTDQHGAKTTIKAGATITVPPSADINVSGAPLAFSSGSDVLMQGSGTLTFTHSGPPFTLPDGIGEYQADVPDDGQAEQRWVMCHGFPRRVTHRPVIVQEVTVDGGATITVSGVAEVTLAPGAQVSAPGRKQPIKLSRRRMEFRWPETANSLVGTMWMMITTALVTVFGIGAELGIAWELGTRLSDASPGGHNWVAAIIWALAICAQAYSVTALCTMANPQPGSSMSATPGTSFTL